ncbi:MAG: energy transducer TonB [Burkholderiales bacterium]|jgi:protein TonB|nr:energy transducer TonB [Burkholderiales bacterium]
MNDWITDSVPLTARGFLLVLVVCLHIVGATALLRLSGLPQHHEAPTILRASWIEVLPSLPPLHVTQPTESKRVPEHRQVRSKVPVPAPLPLQTTETQPVLAPIELPVSEDAVPHVDVPVIKTAAKVSGDKDYVDPDFNANYLSNPKPAYPFQSRRLREQGVVQLRVHVTAEGYASEVALHTSSGYERLDKAAVDAVKRWQFRPARRAGTPVAGWVVVPVRFELQ